MRHEFRREADVKDKSTVAEVSQGWENPLRRASEVEQHKGRPERVAAHVGVDAGLLGASNRDLLIFGGELA
jgi:hypothetical protein